MFILSKHYDQEYKEYVAKLIEEDGRVASEVSYELEIAYSTIRRWTANYKKKMSKGSEEEKYITPGELTKLQKQHAQEVQRLKEENKILKKALHIFTKNQA